MKKKRFTRRAFSKIANIVKTLGTLSDPATRALLLGSEDPFDFNAPYPGEGNSGKLKNHIWIQVAVSVLQRCIMRAEYDLRVNGISGPTMYDKIFDQIGGNTPAKTLFMYSSMWYYWEGEFFWWWQTGYRPEPDEIQVLDPRKVRHSSDNPATCKYFYDKGNGQLMPLEDGHFLHIMMPNIYTAVRGVFPLFSTGNTLLMQDKQVDKGNLNALYNGAIPDVVLKSKLRVNEQQVDAAKKAWNDAFSKSKEGSSVAVIGGNMDMQVLSQDLIKYINLLDWNRTAILAAYGVPLKVANAESERTALSGKDSNEQYTALFSQTVIPTLVFWEGEINRQLYTATGHPEISGVFSLDKVPELQEDKNRVSKRENDDIKAGKVLINEVREANGQTPLPWGDIWWKEKNLLDVSKPEDSDV